MDSLRRGNYHVTFISRHPANKYLCDDAVRWLSEWQEYYLDDFNIIPDLTKYTMQTDSVHLTDTSYFLNGPFNFDSQSDIISSNQYTALRHWDFLLTSCNELYIVSPLISTHTTAKPKKKKRK